MPIFKISLLLFTSLSMGYGAYNVSYTVNTKHNLTSIETIKKNVDNTLVSHENRLSVLLKLLSAIDAYLINLGKYQEYKKGYKQNVMEAGRLKGTLFQYMTTLVKHRSLTIDFDQRLAISVHRFLLNREEENKKTGNTLKSALDKALLIRTDTAMNAVSFFQALYKHLNDKALDKELHKLIVTTNKEVDSYNLSDIEKAISSEENMKNPWYPPLQEEYQWIHRIYFPYTEFLEYLSIHVHYLTSPDPGWLYGHIKHLIETVNALFSSHLEPHVSKMFLAVCIILFFLIISRGLALFLIFIMQKFIRKTSVHAGLHHHALHSILRPLQALIIFQAITFSVRIFIFPEIYSGVYRQALSSFDVLIIVWTLFNITSYYGEHIFGRFISRRKLLRKEIVNLFVKVIHFLVVIIALLTLLHIWNIDPTAVITSLGIGSLAIAFAAKDILANFFSSLSVIADQSVSQGDWIVCDGNEGTVVEIGLKNTTIRTFDNALVYIPNAKIAEGTLKNWDRRVMGRRIKMEVGVTYTNNLQKLETTIAQIRQMLKEHREIADPEKDTNYVHSWEDFKRSEDIVSINDYKGYRNTLLVYLDNLGESSINILVYCFSKTVSWNEWLKVKEDVIFKILKIVDDNGLEIAYPTRTLHIEPS